MTYRLELNDRSSQFRTKSRKRGTSSTNNNNNTTTTTRSNNGFNFNDIMSSHPQQQIKLAWTHCTTKHFYIITLPFILFLTVLNISPPNDGGSSSPSRTTTEGRSSSSSSSSISTPFHFSLRQTNDDVPSHIKICEALNKALTQRQIFEPTENVVVDESPTVCRDRITPYESLLRIFASAFLGEISRRENLGITYKNCDTTTFTSSSSNNNNKVGGAGDEASNNNNPPTIQEWLPNPLLMVPLAGIDTRTVSDVCSFCLQDFEKLGRRDASCVLFGDGDGRFELMERARTTQSTQTFMEAMIPSMRQNLNKGVSSWMMNNGGGDLEDDLMFQTRLSELTVDAKWNVEDNFKTNAVVYLSCELSSMTDDDDDKKKGEECDTEAMRYTHVYGSSIPSSVRRIDVMVSKECQSKKPGQAGPLVRWFQKSYPRSKVVGPTAVDDTARLYAVMMQAKYLVCPPGFGCLLASMATTNFATIVKSPSWLESRMLPATATLLPTGEFQKSQCLQLRGRFGYWEQDMMLAPALQYITPIYHYAGEAQMKFNASLEKPYRTSTTFKWVENEFPQCEMELLTLEDFCDTLQQMQITRLFYIGDSLAFNMAQSFWKLLLNTNNPTPLGPGTYHETDNWTRMFTCPNNHVFRIAFARNDQLIENNLQVSVPDKIRNCQAYCYKWTTRYLEFDGKTLMIAATGPHYHHFPDFKTAFDRFVERVDAMKRTQDIVFFRTAVPGHENCQESAGVPFRNYEDYAPTATDLYSWDKFIEYNDYATRVLHERRKNRAEIMTGGGGPPTQTNNAKQQTLLTALDVFPMTVLRRDGHVGGEEQLVEARKGTDCLHYNMPGPVDWWNHLMYSQLLTIQGMTTMTSTGAETGGGGGGGDGVMAIDERQGEMREENKEGMTGEGQNIVFL